MKEGRLPGLSRLAKMGGFSALGTVDPRAEPGRLVRLHHRPRRRRARHLRLHPPRPRDDDSRTSRRAARSRPKHVLELGRLAVPALGRQGRAAPPGPRLLGDPRAARRPDHGPAHPRELPAVGHGQPRAVGDGDARRPRRLRYVLLLHDRSPGLPRQADLGRERLPRGGDGRRRSRPARSGPDHPLKLTTREADRPTSRSPSTPIAPRSSSSSATRCACCRRASGATGCRSPST